MLRNDRMAVLLILTLAGCGGGGGAQNEGVSPPPSVEDEAPATPAPQGAAVEKPAPLDSSLIPEPGQELVRETFSYGGGSRDPFASLLEGRGIGPELGDLDLVGVIYVERDAESSAVVLRDRVSGRQYTAKEGERVGRARVSSIGARSVTFTVDDFGTQREVTLSLRKREDVP